MTSKLDRAMRIRMDQIVFNEQRPFCYIDFQKFTVEGVEYRVSHGTFRNKISKLMKQGEVHIVCYSPQGFYTVNSLINSQPRWNRNNSLSKIFTEEELTYFRNKPIYRELKHLPFEDCGLHNLHLKFECNGLWQLLYNSRKYKPMSMSEDIILVALTTNHLIIKATVHRTNTVTVVIKCSHNQVILSLEGINRLDNALSLLEDQIRTEIAKILSGGNHYIAVTVPSHSDWIVTLWHFAIDSSSYYSGERFFCSWKISKTILISVYSKWWPEEKYRIRIECQECPGVTIASALGEKLYQVQNRH